MDSNEPISREVTQYSLIKSDMSLYSQRTILTIGDGFGRNCQRIKQVVGYIKPSNRTMTVLVLYSL